MIERWEQFDRALKTLLAGGPAYPEFAELLALAEDLREAPRPEFQQELRKELERTMSIAAAYKREGFRTITPYISVKNAADVVSFLKQTFGAELTGEIKAPSGGVHREVRMLGSMLMLGERLELPTALHVFVDDVDAAYARALAAGAETLMGDQGKPADRHYGERSAFVKDMGGNYWYIGKRIGNPEPVKQPVVPYLHPRSASQLIRFLKTVFDAQELGVYRDGDRIAHASLMIGDSTIEMGEGSEPKEQGLYVYLEDPDGAYNRAIANGATSIYPPKDQFYGERSGGFRDPAGNSWFVSRLL
jgi:uncharacterized glyoxalase superfamily protein PhnB